MSSTSAYRVFQTYVCYQDASSVCFIPLGFIVTICKVLLERGTKEADWIGIKYRINKSNKIVFNKHYAC